MRTCGCARLLAVLAVTGVLGACGAAGGTDDDGGSPTASLELRAMTSSTPGPCSAPPLTAEGPGTACDRTDETTYAVGPSLGVVTPTSVTRDGTGAEQTLLVQLDEAGTTTLGDVTAEMLGTQLAILLDGRVISAPLVGAPLTTGDVTISFGSAAEAEELAAALGATPRS